MPGFWGCCVYSIWKLLDLRPKNFLSTQPLVLRFVPLSKSRDREVKSSETSGGQ